MNTFCACNGHRAGCGWISCSRSWRVKPWARWAPLSAVLAPSRNFGSGSPEVSSNQGDFRGSHCCSEKFPELLGNHLQVVVYQTSSWIFRVILLYITENCYKSAVPRVNICRDSSRSWLIQINLIAWQQTLLSKRLCKAQLSLWARLWCSLVSIWGKEQHLAVDGI